MTQTTDAVLAQIDGAIHDWTVGPDAMRSNAPASAGLGSMPSLQFDPEAMGRMSLRISAAFSEFARGMARMAKAVDRLVQQNPALRRLLGLPVYDKHHPRPLCIDGAAYARRRRARARRR